VKKDKFVGDILGSIWTVLAFMVIAFLIGIIICKFLAPYGFTIDIVKYDIYHSSLKEVTFASLLLAFPIVLVIYQIVTRKKKREYAETTLTEYHMANVGYAISEVYKGAKVNDEKDGIYPDLFFYDSHVNLLKKQLEIARRIAVLEGINPKDLLEMVVKTKEEVEKNSSWSRSTISIELTRSWQDYPKLIVREPRKGYIYW
jgi:hypothetical protein